MFVFTWGIARSKIAVQPVRVRTWDLRKNRDELSNGWVFANGFL